jgi:hypothetical protein
MVRGIVSKDIQKTEHSRPIMLPSHQLHKPCHLLVMVDHILILNSIILKKIPNSKFKSMFDTVIKFNLILIFFKLDKLDLHMLNQSNYPLVFIYYENAFNIMISLILSI